MMEKWRVLLVEDDPDGQELVRRILLHHKIQADVVDNAEQALTLMKVQDYAGVIIDLTLPGMSGWSLLDLIQRSDQTTDLPCVAITAYHSPDVAVAARQAGFAGYFAKPLETSRFIQTLEGILN